MVDLGAIAGQLGIATWLLVIIFIWTLFWKVTALWKSSRDNKFIWFLAIFFFNTVGILPILYIYVFSKIKVQEKPKKTAKKKPKSKKIISKKKAKKKVVRNK